MSARESSRAFTLDHRYLRESGPIYLTGVQALLRLMLDCVRLDRCAGRNTAVFVSGYQGSPLAGLDVELKRYPQLLADHGVVHQPGLNEELAATSILGSQLAARLGSLRPDGVLGFWYGKAPGLDRASDALRHANMAGTHPSGGAVALVGDDPSAKSSSFPSASELELADLAIPVFYPADCQDLLDLGWHAVQMSRATGLWTSLKVVTNVADAAGTATVRPDRRPVELSGGYGHQPNGRLLGAELAALERSLHEVRLPLAVEYLRASRVNTITGRPGDRVGIVAAGKSYLDVCQALRILGLDDDDLESFGIRLLRLGAIFPLEPTTVREFASGLREIVVVEEKRAFIEPAIKALLYGVAGAPAIYGRNDAGGGTLFSALGELDPDKVAAGLARRLLAHGECAPVRAWTQRRRQRVRLPLLARTPYFCSGCPHNSSTKVPDGTLVGGGIGCHTLALFMPSEQVGEVMGITQMGGEGAQWFGMAPFVRHRHIAQNMGDGTFTHSGSLAIRAAVAAGVNITYKLLYNAAVAMTGGQHPVGVPTVDKLAALLLAEGVSRVVITSDRPDRLRGVKLPRGVEVHDRSELVRWQQELSTVPGVTVLIHDQECAAMIRRKRRRGQVPTPLTKVYINERVCEGCGDCGKKSNCLSVQPVATEFGPKTQIHQSSCNVDYSCLAGDCPSFLTVVPGKRRQPGPMTLTADALPQPGPTVADDFTARIVGVGGAGVVTVCQLLATAAAIEGRHVRALDQTGLAQKGGAVVSDIKISTTLVTRAARLVAGECDLYLACDPLVGTDPAHLAAADAGHTIAVVSTSQVPTGQMVVDNTIHFPTLDSIRSAVDDATAKSFYLDARGLALVLFGDDQYATVLQLGAAYQTGEIPLPANSIERAIQLNGVAVQTNLQAFRRGRQAIADPEALHAAVTPAPAAPRPLREPVTEIRDIVQAAPGGELARLLDVRILDLVGYQNHRYAIRYAEFVEQVRQLEGNAGPVTSAVAKNLYKLMAYKDEYEIARLSLDRSLTTDIEAQFGEGARYTYHLHPPLLRAMGMRHKIRLGRWSRPALYALREMRRLRGTRLDIFGYTRLRRVERQLVAEYRQALLAAFATTADSPSLVTLAELPDLVRGYEDIKLANIALYRNRQIELLGDLHRPRDQERKRYGLPGV